MNTTENNKLIAEFLGRNFSVDNKGIIYNAKGVKMKTTTTKSGYERFNTSRPTKSFLVHRLVAMAFIPNPENKPEVNHKDGNKLNNCVSNLEWNTRSENIKHGFNNGLISKNKKNVGSNHWRSIPILAKDSKGNIVHFFESAGQAQKTMKYDRNSIRDAVKGKLKTYKGLFWYNCEHNEK